MRNWLGMVLTVGVAAQAADPNVVVQLVLDCDGRLVLSEARAGTVETLRTCAGLLTLSIACGGDGRCDGKLRDESKQVLARLTRRSNWTSASLSPRLSISVLGENRLPPAPRTLGMCVKARGASACSLVSEGTEWRVALGDCRRPLFLQHGQRLDAPVMVFARVAEEPGPRELETDFYREVELRDGCGRPLTLVVKQHLR